MILKDILGYEGVYAASEDGTVFRTDTREGKPICRPVANRLKNTGYISIHLCFEARRRDARAHRLVWEAFNGRIPDGLEINHKNGIRTDNRISNLEVVTKQENAIHKFKVNGYRSQGTSPQGSRNHAAKITEDDVRTMRRLYAEGVPQHALGRQFGISQPMVGNIVRRENWTHVKD